MLPAIILLLTNLNFKFRCEGNIETSDWGFVKLKRLLPKPFLALFFWFNFMQLGKYDIVTEYSKN